MKRLRLSWPTIARLASCLSACCFVLACLSCDDQSSNNPVDIKEMAKRFELDLPPDGFGPVKQFVTRASQSGQPMRKLVYFEWPSGTEELKGLVYEKTRITVVEKGREPLTEFRFLRTASGKLMGIEKAQLEFGEYFLRPAEIRLGDEWRSKDATQSSECRVVDTSNVSVAGEFFEDCLKIQCKQETVMPDGEVFRGETTTHQCDDIGMVMLNSSSSNGVITIEIQDTLESYTWNGARSGQGGSGQANKQEMPGTLGDG